MPELPQRYTALSKYLSFLLRHHPEEGDLEIDERGWTGLEDVLDTFKGTKHSWAKEEDIQRLIKEGDKERFQIRDGKIRALYGHSIDVDLKDKSVPPDILYHGTSPSSLEKIFQEGLKPMGRQYVHLSKEKEDALAVGRRHTVNPVLLKVEAERAHRDGIDFMDRGEVFLVKKVPPEYIELSENGASKKVNKH